MGRPIKNARTPDQPVFQHLFPMTVSLTQPSVTALAPVFAILFPAEVALTRLRRQLVKHGEATHETRLPISDGGPEVDVGIKHIGEGHVILAVRYPSNQLDDHLAERALLARIQEVVTADALASDVSVFGESPLLDAWSGVASIPLSK